VTLVGRFACNHRLGAERDAKVTEAEQGARTGEREWRSCDREEQAGNDLEPGAADDERAASGTVGSAPERDRDEEWNQREGGPDQPDLPRPGPQPQQAVRRHRPRDVDGRLADRKRQQGEQQPAR
jgi:hypothetical protein